MPSHQPLICGLGDGHSFSLDSFRVLQGWWMFILDVPSPAKCPLHPSQNAGRGEHPEDLL